MEIPPAWGSMLRLLSDAGFDACIAGGAPRDLLHDVEIKDVDVFASPKGDTDSSVWRLQEDIVDRINAAWGAEGEILQEWSDEDYAWDGLICAGVVNYQLASVPQPVQVIVVERPAGDYVRAILEDFDINLCRIGIDIYGVTGGAGFVVDYMDKTMTVSKPWSQCSTRAIERTTRLLRRLRKKYPSHKIVWEGVDTVALLGDSVETNDEVFL